MCSTAVVVSPSLPPAAPGEGPAAAAASSVEAAKGPGAKGGKQAEATARPGEILECTIVCSACLNCINQAVEGPKGPGTQGGKQADANTAKAVKGHPHVQGILQPNHAVWFQ